MKFYKEKAMIFFEIKIETSQANFEQRTKLHVSRKLPDLILFKE